MKTKQIILCFAAVACCGLLASCTSDNEPTTSTLTYQVTNYIVPADTQKDVELSNSTYVFRTEDNQMLVNETGMKIEGTAYNFTTDQKTFKLYSYNQGQIITVEGNNANINSNPSLPLRNFNCAITTFVYYTPVAVPGVVGVNVITPVPVMKYDIGDLYTVRTFSRDAYFCGTTSTFYPDAEGNLTNYENKNIIYRMVIDIDKLTADLVMYQAQFAPQAPVLSAIVLKGLNVKLTRSGFDISGTNIVPEVGEGNSTTPNPKYTFDSVQFHTASEDLSQATIRYTVGGRFSGSFTGAYLLLNAPNSQQ